MASTNTLLNSDTITREAMRVLHQKLVFVGAINRQYDSSFANSGAKIGTTLKIRKPQQFTVRTGATYTAQNNTEATETLTVASQKGIDFDFSSVELTMKLDDFSARYIKPAMSVLAANIEADALSMYKDVYQYVDGLNAAATFAGALRLGKRLTDSLAPVDNRKVILDTQSRVDLLDATKGLFQASTNISDQYREGVLGRTAGFDWYETSLMPRHTTGTAAATTGYLTNQVAAQTGSSLIVDTGTTTFLIGDMITIEGVNEVHPETKTDTGRLKTFVVTANSGSSATTLAISPAIVASGPTQNVTNGAANDKAIVKYTGVSDVHDQSLAFHPDAFTFVTADLEVPRGLDMASRVVSDGISMRFVRDFDTANDLWMCRFDVLYGYKAIRPELAVRFCVN